MEGFVISPYTSVSWSSKNSDPTQPCEVIHLGRGEAINNSLTSQKFTEPLNVLSSVLITAENSTHKL